MRLLVLLASLACLASLAAAAGAAPAPAAARPVFVVTGGGWGHGVGMSQWGALGQARAGRTHAQILATYYSGTKLSSTAPRTVRVLVVPSAKALTVGSEQPVRARDAAGAVVELPAGETALGPKLEVGADGRRKRLRSPVLLQAVGGGPLELEGTTYRGQLRVTSDGTALQVVNVVGLEPYLQGVVPGEMPRGWPLEALKAQAVAARTYAIVSLVKGKPFDLYSDWRSQVYYGVDEESPSTTRAVRETRGQVLTYDGLPAQTLYFSSSGGRTRSAVDAYGTDLPYLVAVDDPWDDVAGNPNHRWDPVALGDVKLAAALGAGGRIVDVATELGTDGRPVTVTFTSASGALTRLSARDVRTKLRLRSTSFRLGVLRLDPPRAPADGEPYRLEGLARDVTDPRLERRVADGSWQAARKVAVRPDGTFVLLVRPGVTTTYRLTGDGVPGPLVTVAAAGS
jgi:stage II sporulation protein D